MKTWIVIALTLAGFSSQASFLKGEAQVTLNNHHLTAVRDLRAGDRLLGPGGKEIHVLHNYTGMEKIYTQLKVEGDRTLFISNDQYIGTPKGLIRISEVRAGSDVNVLGEHNDEKTAKVLMVSQHPADVVQFQQIEVDSPEHVFYANGIAVGDQHVSTYNGRH